MAKNTSSITPLSIKSNKIVNEIKKRQNEKTTHSYFIAYDTIRLFSI